MAVRPVQEVPHQAPPDREEEKFKNCVKDLFSAVASALFGAAARNPDKAVPLAAGGVVAIGAKHFCPTELIYQKFQELRFLAKLELDLTLEKVRRICPAHDP